MKQEKRKVAIYLFNEENPQGRMFSFYDGKNSEEYKQMIVDGWVDTPARLNLPKNMDTGITKDDASKADPKHLKKILENYGFIVITQEQLKAEAVRMANIGVDLGNFSDEDIINEAVRRGLKESDDVTVDEAIKLLDLFKEDPSKLTAEEKIQLGKDIGVSLRSNWSDEVMIEKINEKINELEA